MFLKDFPSRGQGSMSKSNRNKAVALKYNTDKDLAPVIIASGTAR